VGFFIVLIEGISLGIDQSDGILNLCGSEETIGSVLHLLWGGSL
jgi:hypothetical protein